MTVQSAALVFVVTTIPGQIRVSALLAEGTTRDDAAAIAALFPKSLKVTATRMSTATGESGMVCLTVNTKANGVIGETNETGNKRFESFLKHAARLGFTVEVR